MTARRSAADGRDVYYAIDPDPGPVDREQGRTYRLDPLEDADGSWELGWDVRLGVFFAQQVVVDVDGTVLA